jgi:hypothetical protein
MVMPDETLGILGDGPFRGGTFIVRYGQSLTFGVSWLNPTPLVYHPTGDVVDTAEGEALVLRCGEDTPAGPAPVDQTPG